MMIVLTTVPIPDVAESLAEQIVNAQLAACVQILPQMTSVYVWKGDVQKENEHLLLIKTTRQKYDDLESFIIANHPYELPEIVAIEPERVSASYARWLVDAVT